MTDCLTLSRAEVIARLGVPSWWWRHGGHKRLREQHGFPPPVPGLCRRWDPLAIDAWLARQRGEAPIAASPATDGEPDWAALLDSRAAMLGRSRAA